MDQKLAKLDVFQSIVNLKLFYRSCINLTDIQKSDAYFLQFMNLKFGQYPMLEKLTLKTSLEEKIAKLISIKMQSFFYGRLLLLNDFSKVNIFSSLFENPHNIKIWAIVF